MMFRMVIPYFLLLAAAQPQPREYERNIKTTEPAIRYWEDDLRDPVSRLQARLDEGAVSLEYTEDGTSYLPSLLHALGIESDTQVLVFSKTSLQRSKISPDVPRAIYFGEDVAVGFVPGGDTIEIASYDPRQGGVFFTLPMARSEAPRFERPRICLSCHHDVATLGIPGMYVGSVTTSEGGRPSYTGSIVSDHRTPFEDRWGGWFVDGVFDSPHRGNAAASGPQGDFVASLLRKYETERYLEPTSDVVALMVLEHQTQMANYFIRLNWESRVEEGPTDERLDEVARYMTFLDEATFEGTIEGASTFARTFPLEGPRDRRGRSLRELDLRRKLFRYPLSYMIESDAFAALPDSVREPLLKRIHDALTERASVEAEAAAALEIVRETVDELPPYWRTSP